jgi:hypothetical protein
MEKWSKAKKNHHVSVILARNLSETFSLTWAVSLKMPIFGSQIIVAARAEISNSIHLYAFPIFPGRYFCILISVGIR